MRWHIWPLSASGLNYLPGWPSQQKTSPAEADEVKQQQEMLAALTGTGEGNFHLLLVQQIAVDRFSDLDG